MQTHFVGRVLHESLARYWKPKEAANAAREE
jgi:hypothetical protein